MEFSTKEDIEAPIDQVFTALSDFDAVERQVIKRGVDLQRVTDPGGRGEGMAWKAKFKFRGKERKSKITLALFDAPQEMQFDLETGGLGTQTVLECVALSRSRTRVSMVVTLQPKTLSARLLVQSMKLARSNINKRFRLRMADFAKQLEERLNATS